MLDPSEELIIDNFNAHSPEARYRAAQLGAGIAEQQPPTSRDASGTKTFLKRSAGKETKSFQLLQKWAK